MLMFEAHIITPICFDIIDEAMILLLYFLQPFSSFAFSGAPDALLRLAITRER